MIYHIVTESDLRANVSGDVYTPTSLADCGFIHCALQTSVIAVANDYFSEAAGPVLLLEIDPERLTSEVRYEAAAPIAGGGTAHLVPATLFPHVYGPINTEAIVRVGVLGVTPDGYQWPGAFEAWDAFKQPVLQFDEHEKTAGRDAAVQRVRAVIESLDRERSTPVNTGDAKADFRTVTITTHEGEALRKWVLAEKATHTVEVGLAFGFSALYICEGLLLNGNPDPRHVTLDPWQASGYANRGLEILEEAGVRALIEFHGEKSQWVLPRFLKEGRQFDLAFIDGNHRFDAVFLDLYYLGQLVRKGGIIILDDYNLPGIKKAAAFFINNLAWKVEETSSPKDEHQWLVLRTAEGEDTRDFRYFVEF